ncbi:MAG TPA: cell envelope integrity EipB family protein [Acetobacteraceae bacterium]|nr:cell envelope integrity EipB family protein [Acetobacteraceae bacterium]
MRLSAALAVPFLLLFAWDASTPIAQAAGLPAPVTAPAPLAAHHALYALTLDNGREGDIVAATGTMGYEVIDACDGWAVRQRLDMTVTNSDGQDIHMISDYATWESKDGLKLRFHMKQTTDSAVTSQTDGNASLQRRGGPGEVHYTMPKDNTVTLPAGTLFPMAHTEAIITAAREGKKFLTLPLFDGTDENGAEDSSIAILDWKQPFQTKWPLLSSLPSTRVRLAFFDRKPDTITPNYQVGMRYWENGVADEMQMDFGDFVMNARMTEFAPQPHKC